MSGFDPTQEVRELRWRIKQLNKQVGKQGETIHSLRAELAEVRELNSKVDRGEIRRLQRAVQAGSQALRSAVEVIDRQREKLDSRKVPAVADTFPGANESLGGPSDLVQSAP